MTLDEFQAFTARIEALEQEAHRVGLRSTARSLNQAKNCAGWEMAELIEKEAKGKSRETT